MPNHYPEHLLFKWIVLRIVIWHIFLEIEAKVKIFLRLSPNSNFTVQQESLQGNVEINFPLEMLLFICCLPPDLTPKIAVRERTEGEELFCIALLVVVSESLAAARILFF